MHNGLSLTRLFGWVLVIVFAVVVVLSTTAASLWRLSPLLPNKDDAVCFAGDFDPLRPIHLQSFGYDMRKGRFKQEETGAVTVMRVEIRRRADDGISRRGTAAQSDDWYYTLRIEAELADGQRLSSAASCPWGDSWVDQANPQLACYIDCEGGSVSAWRQVGRNALSVRFEPRERLRMLRGCGDAGSVGMGADTEARSFTVERTRRERCASIGQ